MIQRRLASRVVLGTPPGHRVRTVAGLDCAFGAGRIFAAAVVLRLPGLVETERVVVSMRIPFPYVPGLLSFREMPLILDAVDRLKELPDLFMLDGQGYAHPRRFGIACHLGVFLDRPSLGCAKSVLWGRYDKEKLGPNPGDQQPILDYKTRETIGIALRSKVRTNPLIISIGHKIDLPTSVEFVQQCLRGYRLPETTRGAHNFAGAAEAFPVAAHDPTTGETLEQGTLF